MSARAADQDSAFPAVSRLVCHGCGYRVPLEEQRPFACPNRRRTNDVDHVLRRVFDPAAFQATHDPQSVFLDLEPNPFFRYRSMLYSYQLARACGLPDSAYLEIVDQLNSEVASIGGTSGFIETPFAVAEQLAEGFGFQGEAVWIKDETGNVSGSHKARHLMGVMIWLEVTRRLGWENRATRLAIASCGNAALAAGLVAAAAGRPLDVFVPIGANEGILQTLTELGVALTTCARQEADPLGDPCMHRLHEVLSNAGTDGAEAIPFGCQANLNGLTIEGGSTLVWEMVSVLLRQQVRLDHLIVQVGGGALATSCIEGLRNAVSLGLIERLPRIHTVQTQSAYPLRQAYDRIVARLVGSDSLAGDQPDLVSVVGNAQQIKDRVTAGDLASVLKHARRHRGDYMSPWPTPPESIAGGILDDETYDWVAVCEGMLESGGIPLVVDEATLDKAHLLGCEHTSVAADPTGTAGLAGLLELNRAGVIGRRDRVALLFTGSERSAAPGS